MSSLALGRYIPGNSFVHKLDPRIKILCMLFVLIGIFLDTGVVGYIALGLFIVICLMLAKLSFSYIWQAIKPMLIMMCILFVINILVTKTGTLIYTLGPIEIYSDAFSQTAFVIVRLLFMITITTILTATTKPLELTLGIEQLLTPLAKFGVPAHIIAMMISIALRFIPTLIEETERIIKAQSSRGVDFENGKLMEKINAIVSLIVPLFVSAFQRAEDLANAMDARGYVADGNRTRYKQLHITTKDILALIVTLVLLIALVVYTIIK